MQQAIEKAKPLLSKLTFGSVVGYCSGLATQKIAKTVAFLIGVTFMAIQVAASSGIVTMDWEKLQVHCHKILDTTADGKLSAEDAKLYWQKVKSILTKNIPSAGGFSFGFLYGLRYG